MVPYRHVALLVGLTVIAAGCLGGPKALPQPSQISSAPPPITDSTCSIRGLVTDDEQIPIPGVQVGVLGTALAALTGEDGGYALGPLEPATYSVSAVKVGYDPRTKTVQCVGGEAAQLDFELKESANTFTPFYRQFAAFQGMMTCSLGLYGVSSTEPCRGTELGKGSRTTAIYYPEPTRVTGAVFEMKWEPSGGTGGKFLRLTMPSINKPANKTFATNDQFNLGSRYVQGESLLNLTIRSTDDGADYIWKVAKGGNLQFTMAPSTGSFSASNANTFTRDDGGKFVTNQRFDLYTTFFYNDSPVPEGWTHFS